MGIPLLAASVRAQTTAVISAQAVVLNVAPARLGLNAIQGLLRVSARWRESEQRNESGVVTVTLQRVALPRGSLSASPAGAGSGRRPNAIATIQFLRN